MLATVCYAANPFIAYQFIVMKYFIQCMKVVIKSRQFIVFRRLHLIMGSMIPGQYTGILVIQFGLHLLALYNNQAGLFHSGSYFRSNKKFTKNVAQIGVKLTRTRILILILCLTGETTLQLGHTGLAIASENFSFFVCPQKRQLILIGKTCNFW